MRFKRKSHLAIILFALFTLTAVVAASAAGAGQPGSDADPLVTKSYVDQQIAKLQAQTGSTGTTGTVDSQEVAKLQTDVGDLTKFIIDALNEIQSLKAKVDVLESGYAVVEIKAGQTILLSAGSEAILRGGKATAIKGTNGGLADVTSGADLGDNASIPLQHLLLSSRSDGRGFTAKTDIFILVRGGYTVK